MLAAGSSVTWMHCSVHYEVLWDKKACVRADAPLGPRGHECVHADAIMRPRQGCQADDNEWTDGRSDDGRWVVRDLDAL
jgi:hypothetical protein